MKKFLFYTGLVLFAVTAIDVLCSLAIDGLTGKQYVAAISATEDATEEVAIIGSSRASHHYDPRILTDCLGLTAHNYGLEGQNIYADATITAMLMRHAKRKPRMVIIDLSEPDICDVPGWNTDHLDLFFPYASEPAVDSLLSDVLDPRELFFVRHSALYRHNSRLIEYIRKDTTRTDGFSPLQGQWDAPPEDVKQGQPYRVDPRKVEYLEKAIKTCTANGADIVLAISPNYRRLPKEQLWVKTVEEVARRHNTPFLYFEQDEQFLAHPEWFREPYHLNATGAAVFTRKLVKQFSNPTP